MKKLGFLLVGGLLSWSASGLACDAVLKGSRDCQLQDRYRALKSSFADVGVDLSDVAEYKAIRFIDRDAWENAKIQKTAPNFIYGPAPISWNVWNAGIESLFPNKLDIKNLTSENLSTMNRVLLTDGTDTIKDDRTDEEKQPGELREPQDAQIGFCSRESVNHRELAESSLQSMLAVQARIEKTLKISFQKLIEKEGGRDSGLATLGATLRGMVPGCGAGTGVWVSYVRSELVAGNMDWIRILIRAYFKNENLKTVLKPIEFAALIQKWLVTVHPYADGNGRTSRAVQDLILENFDLPYAPGGDLQNDALEEYTKYVENNYLKTEQMLTRLEGCLAEYQSGIASISFGCQTTQKLNVGSGQ